MHTTYFYSSLSGFLAGVAGVLLGLPVLALIGLVIILLLGAWFVLQTVGRSPAAVAAGLFLFCALVGLVRGGVSGWSDHNSSLDALVNQNVTVQALVVSRPAKTDYGQSFTAQITRVQKPDKGKEATLKTKAVVYAAAYPELAYGDRISLSGRLEKPEAFETDSGREFPYPQYLAREDIFYEMYQPTVSRLDERDGLWIKRQLADLRAGLLSALHTHIPDPHAALAGGVLLGAEDSLGEDLQADFRRTSLIHIVVLSGFNVMIVATAVGEGLALLGLSLWSSTVAAFFGILLFALLVGLTPTVVRASIMAVFALIARITGRQYAASRGLGLAAAGMVFVNPEILLFDPSFQLSAIATAGLIMFGGAVEEKLSFLPTALGMREAATATISAQIAVLPLLLYYTGMLSSVSLPANLLVLPVVPALMAIAAVTILLHFLLPVLAFIPAAGSFIVADYVFGVVRWLADLPFSAVSIPAFSVWLVIGVYIVMIAVYQRGVRRRNSTKRLPAPKT